MRINNRTIKIVHGSVTEQDVDAIVNAANTSMRGGGGIDGRIHDEAGPGLLKELEKVAPDGAETGTIIVTGGHQMKQPHIIHTPGPVWKGGTRGEPEQLASCYRSCMQVAGKMGLKSIAFCSISTGVYGSPVDQAAPTAIQTVLAFLRANPKSSMQHVVFAMYELDEFRAFSAALRDEQRHRTT